jgi:hypothetical protein
MLVPVDHVRKYYVGESLYPLACSKYRWHYLSRQTKDEVLLVKTFDSKEDVPAKCRRCGSVTNFTFVLRS